MNELVQFSWPQISSELVGVGSKKSVPHLKDQKNHKQTNGPTDHVVAQKAKITHA